MKTLGFIASALAALAAVASGCGNNSPAVDGNGERHKEKQVTDDDEPTTSAGGGGGGQATPSDPHEAAYAKLLGGQRGPAAKIKEDQSWRAGDWRFFQLQDDSSGNPVFSGRAAVDGKGHAVSPRLVADGAWNAFLTADGVDAAAALPRVAWLFEAAPVSKTGDDAPISDPKAKAMVEDPKLEKTATGVRFVGWFARPPDFDPWRTTIDAPTTGPAKVVEEMWHKLPPR